MQQLQHIYNWETAKVYAENRQMRFWVVAKNCCWQHSCRVTDEEMQVITECHRANCQRVIEWAQRKKSNFFLFIFNCRTQRKNKTYICLIYIYICSWHKKFLYLPQSCVFFCNLLKFKLGFLFCSIPVIRKVKNMCE